MKITSIVWESIKITFDPSAKKESIFLQNVMILMKDNAMHIRGPNNEGGFKAILSLRNPNVYELSPWNMKTYARYLDDNDQYLHVAVECEF